MNIGNVKFIVCIVSILLYVFPLTSAISNNFDLGTQFGASYLDYTEGSLRYINLPSSVPSLGTSFPPLYLTYYPNEHIGMSPEASYGYSSDAGYTYHLGFRLSGLLHGYTSSTPYISISTSYYGMDLTKHGKTELVSYGAGLGYHFNFYSNVICRIEVQYKRLTSISGYKMRGNKALLAISLGNLFSSY